MVGVNNNFNIVSRQGQKYPLIHPDTSNQLSGKEFGMCIAAVKGVGCE